PARNRYYRSIEASAGRVHLIDGSMVDSWALHGARVAGAPQRWSLPAGTIDTASTGSRLCALASDGSVSCWQNERMIAQARLDEGADAFFHSIAATGSAIFVSYSAGCLSGGCRIETRVLSPDLIPGSIVSGRAIDVTEEGNRLWMLTQNPSEIRRYDITNPLTPVPGAAQPSEGNPVSLAWSDQQQTLYALGAKLIAYDGETLAKTGELLEAWQQDDSGNQYVDQKVVVTGDCAVIAGRESQPRLYRIDGPALWSEMTAPETPSLVRSILVSDGNILLLTNHTLEIWSDGSLPRRRRGAGR
ncbi:MAG TPA: hypothetical protein VM534_06850, partial [Thermoanaerobaculia bacterium]|nr:hypothetical protein [Thermoanaerobaculia bacterium]